MSDIVILWYFIISGGFCTIAYIYVSDSKHVSYWLSVLDNHRLVNFHYTFLVDDCYVKPADSYEGNITYTFLVGDYYVKPADSYEGNTFYFVY